MADVFSNSPWVVDEHPVHALLDGVEEAHGLAINVDDHGSIPAVGILIVTACIKTKYNFSYRQLGDP